MIFDAALAKNPVIGGTLLAERLLAGAA